MSSAMLKIFACIFMLIDHAGLLLFNNNLVLRCIGRLAFPIFAFQSTIGYKNTRNKRKYILRMLIFALISQYPYFLFQKSYEASSLGLNVGFTLLLGLISLYIIDLAKEKNNYSIFLLILPILLSSYLLNVDYEFYGVILIILFYLFDIKEDFVFTVLFTTFATLLYSTSRFFFIFAIIWTTCITFNKNLQWQKRS